MRKRRNFRLKALYLWPLLCASTTRTSSSWTNLNDLCASALSIQSIQSIQSSISSISSTTRRYRIGPMRRPATTTLSSLSNKHDDNDDMDIQHPSEAKATPSRREAILKGASAAFAAFSTLSLTVQASSEEPLPSQPSSSQSSQPSFPQSPTSQPSTIVDLNELAYSSNERSKLLQLIFSQDDKKPTDEDETNVIQAIQNLLPYDPSQHQAGTSKYANDLSGQWQLVYSINAEAFSPLLNLPKVIRPTSFQFIGNDAKNLLQGEQGRIAQVLDFPSPPSPLFSPFSIVLSSGVVPYEPESSVLEIYPPFRLQVQFSSSSTTSSQNNVKRWTIVESKSDAEFRALNSRTEEAQLAGRNLYQQTYLETTGRKGDLRISEVIAGDPVLVVSTFFCALHGNDYYLLLYVLFVCTV